MSRNSQHSKDNAHKNLDEGGESQNDSDSDKPIHLSEIGDFPMENNIMGDIDPNCDLELLA